MSRATNIAAVLIEGASDDFLEVARATPGAIRYAVYGAVPDARLLYSCPCGCGAVGSVLVRAFPAKPFWANTGTRGTPTLQPSIGLIRAAEDQDVENDGYHWHGHLIDGVWRSVYEGRAS